MSRKKFVTDDEDGSGGSSDSDSASAKSDSSLPNAATILKPLRGLGGGGGGGCLSFVALAGGIGGAGLLLRVAAGW